MTTPDDEPVIARWKTTGPSSALISSAKQEGLTQALHGIPIYSYLGCLFTSFPGAMLAPPDGEKSGQTQSVDEQASQWLRHVTGVPGVVVEPDYEHIDDHVGSHCTQHHQHELR